MLEALLSPQGQKILLSGSDGLKVLSVSHDL